jgi:hypothetical protein
MLQTVGRALAGRGCVRYYPVAAAALLLIGAVLRVLGYFGGIEFWLDEAFWAMRIAGGGSSIIRPIGYVWVSEWLIHLRNTEPVIRSVSFVAGLASLPVFLAMCRQAGLSRLASLFGLFILAVHPEAVAMTKEFKPYALELFLHLLLLWLAFSYLRTQKAWRLGGLCLVAAVAPLFSWSVAVLYPGLFLTIAVWAFRQRRFSALLACLGGCVVALGVFLAVFLMRVQGQELSPFYWGRKYDVFFTGANPWRHLRWLLRKTYQVAYFPSSLETFWLDRSVVRLFSSVQAALCLFGVIAMTVGRRWRWVGLWLSPWVVTIALNLLGRWPYGMFRTNLFLMAFSLPPALAALDDLQKWLSARELLGRTGRLIVPAFCALFFLTFVPLDLDYFSTKDARMARTCYVRRAMEVIYQTERDEPAPEREAPEKKRPLLLCPHACGIYSYYRDCHLEARERYNAFFRERYRTVCMGRSPEGAVDDHVERGFWLIACTRAYAASARQYALRHCLKVDQLQDFPNGSLLLRCRGRTE